MPPRRVKEPPVEPPVEPVACTIRIPPVFRVADYFKDPEEPLMWAIERIPVATALEAGVHAGGCGTEEPLCDILSQISHVKHAPRERLQTPPPSYDAGSYSLAYLRTPIRVEEDHRPVPPPIPQEGAGLEGPELIRGVNLRVDGSMPFLIADACGRTLRPVPGYLPRRDYKLADQARIAMPERGYPCIRGSAELFDDKRTEQPSWKPGHFARGKTFDHTWKPSCPRNPEQEQDGARWKASSPRKMQQHSRSLPNMSTTTYPQRRALPVLLTGPTSQSQSPTSLPQNVAGLQRRTLIQSGMSVLHKKCETAVRGCLGEGPKELRSRSCLGDSMR